MASTPSVCPFLIWLLGHDVEQRVAATELGVTASWLSLILRRKAKASRALYSGMVAFTRGAVTMEELCAWSPPSDHSRKILRSAAPAPEPLLPAADEEPRRPPPWRPLLYAARTRAKKKGLAFNLTNEWASSTWTGRCALTGLPFDPPSSMQSPMSPSIDRIDATKGYVIDNCRFILWGMNALKGRGSDEDVHRFLDVVWTTRLAPLEEVAG